MPEERTKRRSRVSRAVISASQKEKDLQSRETLRQAMENMPITPDLSSADDGSMLSLPSQLPLVALKGTVVFPRVVTPIMVGRPISIAALDASVNAHRLVLLVTQREAEKDELEPEDLYQVGTIAFVGQKLNLPNGTVQILVQGQARARVSKMIQTQPFFEAEFELLEEDDQQSLEVEALVRLVQSDFQKFVELGKSMPSEIASVAENIREANKLVDLIASYSELAVEQRQTVLETRSVADRLRLLHEYLGKENEVLELKNKIQHDLRWQHP